MPDGMSPENKQSPSSIESTRSLGWKEAQDFPQPESRANVPDIRMQVNNNEEKENSQDERLDKERKLEEISRYMSDFDKFRTNLSNLTEDVDNLSGFSKKMNEEYKPKWEKRKEEIRQHIMASPKLDDSTKAERIKRAMEKFETRTAQKSAEIKAVLEENVEARRELVHENFTNIINQSFDHLDFVADKLMRYEFPYPYDSRQGSYFLSLTLSEIKNSLADPNLEEGSEARGWMETLYDGVNWARAQHQISEGLNMTPFYYSSLDGMAMNLRTDRHKITAEDLKNGFAMDTRGKGKTKEAATGITVGTGEIDRKVILKTPDKRGRGVIVGLRKDKVQLENIRETAINYQDDFNFWKNAVAAAAQYDYIKDTTELMPRNVFRKDVELKLITDLFATRDINGNIQTVDFNGKKIPKEILNFFTMSDTSQNRQRYFLTMQALLELGARDRLNGLTDNANNLNVGEYDRLISDIDKRVKGLTKKTGFSFKERLSDLVIKQGLTFEIGSAGAGPLSWCWNYKEGKRTWEFGGISQAGDWYTAEFWVGHNYLYDLTAKLRSKVWPASCDARRKADLSKAPTEKPGPTIDEIKTLDPWLYEEVKKVIGEDSEIINTTGGRVTAGQWRKDNKFEIDPDVRLALKEMLWFWETPYTDKDGKRMFFPSFIPHRFKLSFFDQLVVNKDKFGNKISPYTTVADKLRMGGKLSEQDWDSLRQQDWERWLINLNMSERWLRFLAEPGDDRARADLVGSPGSIKEIIKRAELGLRSWFTNFTDKDGKKASAKPLVAEIAIVSQMAILNSAKAEDHGYEGLMTNKITLDIERRKWLERWGEWINMAEYMPPDKGDDHTIYGQSLALLMVLTGNVLYRHALEYGTAAVADRNTIISRLEKTLPEDKRIVRR